MPQAILFKKIDGLLQFPSQSRIAKVQLPTLFMCGKKDEIVPHAMMQSLYTVSMWWLCRVAVWMFSCRFTQCVLAV